MDYFSTRLSGASLAYFNGLADRSISLAELRLVLMDDIVNENKRVAALEKELALRSERLSFLKKAKEGVVTELVYCDVKRDHDIFRWFLGSQSVSDSE